jgi:DNA-binding MarR family transcriptional regulator
VSAIAETHQAAWAALARSHAALVGRIQEALTEAGLPPYQWYELLSALGAAPDGRLTMGELAEALIMTRGGLTKLFDRLEGSGLVSRAACPTDRRSVYAVIDTPGSNLLGEMRPIVTRELDAAFVSRISPAEAKTIAEALERARGSACSGLEAAPDAEAKEAA